MKKVKVRLNPLNGPRFSFGKEVVGIVKLIENALVGTDVTLISVSTSTQLFATDLWCKKKGYELVVYDEEGNELESVDKAHYIVDKEYIVLGVGGLDEFPIDNN